MKNRPHYHEFLELRLQQTDKCILWPHSVGATGYGKVRVGRHCPSVHRLSCEMAYGPAPDGHEAAHSCRNRHCMNPRHLRWATRVENERDKYRDGTDNRGAGNGRARLTDLDVWQIRFFLRGGVRQALLARHFAISEATVSHINTRLTWAHLGET